MSELVTWIRQRILKQSVFLVVHGHSFDRSEVRIYARILKGQLKFAIGELFDSIANFTGNSHSVNSLCRSAQN